MAEATCQHCGRVLKSAAGLLQQLMVHSLRGQVLHFAIDGLILDQLTPGTGRPYDVNAITARLVRRLVPATL